VSASLQSLQIASGSVLDTLSLGNQLKQLSRWLGQFQAVVAPNQAVVVTDNTVTQAATDTQAALQPVLVTAPQKIKATDDKSAAETIVALNAVTAGASATLPSAVNTAPVPAQAANNNTTPNAAVAAGVVEAATSNLSNNTGNSGQGSDRPQMGAMTALSGIAAASNASASTAVSFSKVLKAAAYTPVSEQVAFNIKAAVKGGASKIEIQLNPAELGKLHIKMDVSSDGKATGIIVTAEHKSTLEMLQRDARGLENALADAGIKTDSGSLSFNLRGGQHEKDDTRQALASYAPLLQEEDELAPLAVISRSYVVNAADGLDIQI